MENSYKTIREVKLKTGLIIPKGTLFLVLFHQTPNGSPYLSAVDPKNSANNFKTRNFSAFFETPDMETLGEWVNDGTCETVTGDTTEPDGYGPDGAPSWLLALGMI